MCGRPVPRDALAAFKFKQKQPKGFTCVWSNKGGAARSKLSIWEAQVEGGGGVGGTLGWKRKSKARVSLGHYAVAGHDEKPLNVVTVCTVQGVLCSVFTMPERERPLPVSRAPYLNYTA